MRRFLFSARRRAAGVWFGFVDTVQVPFALLCVLAVCVGTWALVIGIVYAFYLLAQIAVLTATGALP